MVINVYYNRAYTIISYSITMRMIRTSIGTSIMMIFRW